MHTTITQLQGRVPVTVLAVHGNLDGSSYQDLIATATSLYNQGTRDMLLDLSDMPYMSSAGIVALQSIAALLRGGTPPDPEAGWAALHAVDHDRDMGMQRHLKLLNPQPRVDHVLDTVDLKRFFEIHTDLETALASF